MRVRIGIYMLLHFAILLMALWLSDYAITNHELYGKAHAFAGDNESYWKCHDYSPEYWYARSRRG